MKAAAAVLLALSGGTLVFLAWKGFRGNRLLGSANSGVPGAHPVDQPLTNDAKLKLISIASTLQAQINGTIAHNKTPAELNARLQNTLLQLRQ